MKNSKEITLEDLRQLRLKMRKLLEAKKKTPDQLEEAIDALVNGITHSLVQAHHKELTASLTPEEFDKIEEANRMTMKVVIHIFEQYYRMMAAKGVISEPAEAISPDRTEAVYYAYVADYYDHRVEKNSEKVEKFLAERFQPIKANPPDIIKRLVHAGKRLDPQLSVSAEVQSLRKMFYGGMKKVDTPSYAFGELGGHPWGVSAFINVHCRGGMEDTHFIGEFTITPKHQESVPIHMFAVFDGHGGGQCSSFLSVSFPGYLKLYFQNIKAFTDLNIFNAIKLAFVDAHKQFLEQENTSGSTAIVALIINEDLWIANIGDSRAVLSNQGEVLQLSEDQKASTPSIIPGIYKRGGRVIGGRIEMESGSLGPGRAIGDKKFPGVNPRPRLSKISLKEIKSGSWLILACDGFWDVVGSARAVTLIKNAQTVQNVVTTLQTEAINLWTSDNVTIMAVQL